MVKEKDLKIMWPCDLYMYAILITLSLMIKIVLKLFQCFIV